MTESRTTQYGTPLCVTSKHVNGVVHACVLLADHHGGHEWVPIAVAEHRSVLPIDPPPPTLAEDLAAWWRAKAEDEIGQTVAKATEYSGLGGGLPMDLVSLGKEWAFASKLDIHGFTDAQLAEIGVWTFMVGKLGRWSSALRNGRMVSDDTLLDLGVYVRIVQRIRDRGQWP